MTAAPEGPEAPPPGVATAAWVRWALILLSLVGAVYGWSVYVHHAANPAATNAPKFRCPMHPQIVSPTPGDCPICGMALEPIPDAPAARDGGDAATWICPMCPEIVSDRAGQCPKCKMALVRKEPHAAHYHCPMDPEVVSDTPGRCPRCKMALVLDEPPPQDTPAGVVEVKLTLERQQAIGVRTTPVIEQQVSGVLRVAATVTAPEKGQARIHLRTPGYIEAISVSETGVRVRAGQELARVYCPAALEAMNELVTALGFGESGARQVQAAREKLELLGVPPATVEEIRRTGKAQRAFAITTPVSGFITQKNAVLGGYLGPEMALYEITDLSKVWIIAEIFSVDAADISVGTAATFLPAGRADQKVAATVDLIYPQVNAEARSTRVRIVVDNAAAQLKPGQIGTVELARPARKALLIPRDALIDTGRQQYVFVDEGQGRFVPHQVQAGMDLGDTLEVRGELMSGSRVVSGAAFLLDSESRLQASLSQVNAAPPPSRCPAQFDEKKYPAKLEACRRCEADFSADPRRLIDCLHAIPAPWN